jgi:hypothetical protein
MKKDARLRFAKALHKRPQSTSLRDWLSSHALECIALSIPLITGLCYGVGRSVNEGWNEVAAVPMFIFKADVYETILAGINQSDLWRLLLIIAIVSGSYLWLIVVAGNAWTKKFGGLRAKKRRFEYCDDIGLRNRFAQAARKQQDIHETRAQVRARWNILGKRGSIRLCNERRLSKSPAIFKNTAINRVLALILLTSVSVLGSYFLVEQIVFKTARANGARQFVSIYVAVTGTIPMQYVMTHDTREELRSYACQGKQQLSRYRAVRLPSPENNSTTLSYYVIEGDSNTFLLLGKAGSEIRSFGDSPFSLHETNQRPLAAIAKDCS